MTFPRLRYNRYQDENGFAPPHDSRHHAEDLHDFHLPLTALHHAAVPGGGVVRGLEVQATLGGGELTIGPGLAVDRTGRLIVLADDGSADVGADPRSGEHDERPVPVRLTVPSTPGRYLVTMQFNELLRANEGAIGRLEQAPWLRFRPADDPVDELSVVLALAEVTAGADGTTQLAALDAGRSDLSEARRPVGEVVGELALAHGTTTVTETEPRIVSVGTTTAARMRSTPDAALQLSVARAEDAISLTAEDGGPFARLDLRAADTAMAGALRVTATLAVDGAATVAGPLTADGLRSTGTLAVGGEATFGRSLTAREVRSSGPLRVAGPLTCDATASVAGRLTVGELRTSGAVRIDGSLNVVGAISADNDRVSLVAQGGRVGVGTSNPLNDLHVQGGIGIGRTFQSAGSATFYPPDGFAFFHIDNGPSGRPVGRLRISHGSAPGDKELMSVLQTGRVGIGLAAPAASLHVSGGRIRLSKSADVLRFVELRADGSAFDLESQGGDLFINNHGQQKTFIRTLVQPSSGTLKERVADLPDDEAEALLDELRTVTFRYRDDPETVRIGFIAERMPAALATEDRQGYRPADVLAVLTAVIRRQQETLARLGNRLAAIDAPETSSARRPSS